MTLHQRTSSHLFAFTLVAAGLVLTGCSTVNDLLQGDKIDYKSSGKAGPSLDVPPDLNQLSRDTRYVVPGAAVSASAYQVGQATQAVPVAATVVGDVRIERAGNQRWLVVIRPADTLWTPVRDVFSRNFGLRRAVRAATPSGNHAPLTRNSKPSFCAA